MSRNTLRDQRLDSSPHCCSSDALLDALRAVHREIEAAFAELGNDAPEAVAEVSRFSARRMRVGQALLAKRQVVGKVATHLIASVSAEEASAVRALRARAHRYSQLASETVRSWTPEEIRRDWSGYRAASSEIRTTILGLVAAEKELLYPLLGKQGSTRSR